MQDTQTARADDGPPATAKISPDAATDALVDQDGHIIARAVTINKPRAELYAFFRDFTNLPTFMENVERIDVIDATRSHWVVKAPGSSTVEWDALVTEEREGERIAWTSAEGADVRNSGTVTFQDAQANRGTVVTAVIAYDPPGGAIGKLVAKLFQREPAIQARRDLRRFKQLMETGEIATASRNHREYEERG